MPKTVQPTTSGAPDSGDREAFRHFGDGFAGKLVAARLQGYDSGSLSYIDVAVDGTGQLKSAASGGGGAVTVADGADVAQGATSDVAWVSGAGSLIAISKAEFAKLEAIRALLAGTLTVNTGLTDTQLRASAVPISAASLPLPAGAALDATLTGGTAKAIALGEVADATADSGNPVKVGGKFNATQPTYTDGQRGNLQLDSRGNVRSTIQNGVTVAAVQTPADAQAAASGLVVSAKNMLWNGATDDRWRSTGVGDGNNTGVALVNAAKYNGTNLDRDRGNWNTTTGDTGAKTITFGGATQTNYNARGAMITIVCGTVTGTSPTMACQLQFSPDGGTTWIAYGAASANLTATGNTCVINCYPDNGSPTTGATATVNTNGPLPRTWRINYTIGGTSPSFTITAVYVNYVV